MSDEIDEKRFEAMRNGQYFLIGTEGSREEVRARVLNALTALQVKSAENVIPLRPRPPKQRTEEELAALDRDANRPETEADGYRAEALRRAKIKHMADTMRWRANGADILPFEGKQDDG